MSNNRNYGMLSGRVVRDATMAYSESKLAIVNFTIANGRRKLNRKTNEWEDDVSYFSFTYFGPRAERIYPYLLKGQQVNIDYRLKQHIWEKEGKKHYEIRLRIEDIELTGEIYKQKAENSAQETEYYEDIKLPTDFTDFDFKEEDYELSNNSVNSDSNIDVF